MYLVKPTGRKLTTDIRLRMPNGKVVRFTGDRDKHVAKRLGMKIESLVRAKQDGDPPPAELAKWIDNMPESLAKRLISYGLIERRRLERNKSIEDLIDTFKTIVKARKTNCQKHADQQAAKVGRFCKAADVHCFSDIDEDLVSTTLEGWPVAVSTRRSYIIAIKDFAKWMVRSKRASSNPLLGLKPPGQYESPEYERRPLTVAEFRKLMNYLNTFERYPQQHCRWTAYDRKMLYWTAISTGFRQNELRSLTRAHFFLDENPASVVIKAADAKGKRHGEVQIKNELAVELRRYLKHLSPADKVFPMPLTSGSIVDMFRRDLEGAGICWKSATGEIVDFHTLRSTAITWWLTVDGLLARKVQVLARLRSIALVDKYSRNYRMEEFDWLKRGPKLNVPARRLKKAG